MQIKVGELIRAKREEYNISLVDFARQVDISPGYLSQLENGKKTNPSLEVMLKIAQELDLDIDSLLGLDQESETPALRIPSLLRLVIAKDRNLKALEDREIEKDKQFAGPHTPEQISDRRQRVVRIVPGRSLCTDGNHPQTVYVDGDIEKHGQGIAYENIG